MKSVKKVLSLLLVGVVATSSLVGCGEKGKDSKQGNSTTDIEISYLQQGLGSEWLDAIIEGFEKKYPEYNVNYTASASSATISATYGLEDMDTVDLYLGRKLYDVSYMEPLDDVLDTTIEGESKSIREKFHASYLETEEMDGKHYMLTYGGGIEGFVYNKKLFADADITQPPRTTDELILVCDILNDENITPLCHFQSGGYYVHLDDVWFAQYNGMDYLKDFYTNPSKEKMATKDGRYEVLKVHEKLNDPENVLLGSNSDSHVSMQTKFLEGKCAMMLNGSWLSSEMSHIGKMDDFVMMKTPVISSITDKLTTVKTDAELRKLITAIDNVTDGLKTEDTYKDGDNYLVDGKSVSAADWDYVKTARNTMPASYAGTSAFIPTYSNAKEGAKEFLKYLYSDEGYKIYLEALHVVMPLSLDAGEIDTSKWNAFEQNQAKLFQTVDHTVTEWVMYKHDLFKDGGAKTFTQYDYISLMSSRSELDRVNADDVWATIVSRVNDRYENTWMANIK